MSDERNTGGPSGPPPSGPGKRARGQRIVFREGDPPEVLLQIADMFTAENDALRDLYRRMYFDSQRGRNTLDSASEGGKSRAEEFEPVHAERARKCDEMQELHPHLSKRRIAEIVAKKRALGESPDTVRRSWRKHSK